MTKKDEGNLMKAPSELESAFRRHYKEKRFDRFLRSLYRKPHYLPEETTNGRAVIFHGYSGHSEQPHIQHLVHILETVERISTSTVDFPHHGLSHNPDHPEDLGKIKSFRSWVHTVYTTTYKTLGLRSERNLGVTLIGFSAGALAILRFLQLYPEVQKYLAGVILVAVPLEVDQNASEWILKYKRYLEPVFNMLAWFFPNVPVGSLPEGDKNDRLEYHGKVRARSAKELRDAVRDAREGEAMGKINVPILFIHGDSDNIALAGPVEIAYQSIGTPENKKHFIVYRGAPHRILHQAVADIQEWIRARNAAKDWVPVRREKQEFGYVVEKTVRLSSIWFFAFQETLQWFADIVFDIRNSVTRIAKRMIRKK